MKIGSEKGKVTNIVKVYSATNKKLPRHLGDRAKLTEIKTIISTDLLGAYRTSRAVVQHTVQIPRDCSVTLPCLQTNEPDKSLLRTKK